MINFDRLTEREKTGIEIVQNAGLANGIRANRPPMSAESQAGVAKPARVC